MARIERLGPERTDDLADQALDAGMRVAESAGRAAERIKEQGAVLAAKTSEFTEGLGNVAGNVSDAVEDSVARSPMTTLAVAVACGFILGAIWKA